MIKISQPHLKLGWSQRWVSPVSGAQAPSSTLSIRREIEAEDLFSSSGLQATLALESRKPSLERSHFWHQVLLEIWNKDQVQNLSFESFFLKLFLPSQKSQFSTFKPQFVRRTVWPCLKHNCMVRSNGRWPNYVRVECPALLTQECNTRHGLCPHRNEPPSECSTLKIFARSEIPASNGVVVVRPVPAVWGHMKA